MLPDELIELILEHTDVFTIYTFIESYPQYKYLLQKFLKGISIKIKMIDTYCWGYTCHLNIDKKEIIFDILINNDKIVNILYHITPETHYTIDNPKLYEIYKDGNNYLIVDEKTKQLKIASDYVNFNEKIYIDGNTLVVNGHKSIIENPSNIKSISTFSMLDNRPTFSMLGDRVIRYVYKNSPNIVDDEIYESEILTIEDIILGKEFYKRHGEIFKLDHTPMYIIDTYADNAVIPYLDTNYNLYFMLWRQVIKIGPIFKDPRLWMNTDLM